MSIAGLVWCAVCLVTSIAGAGLLVVFGAATTTTTLERTQVLGRLALAFIFLLVFPLCGIAMGSVGKDRSRVQGTRGAGVGDAAMIVGFSACVVLLLGFMVALAVASQNTHLQ